MHSKLIFVEAVKSGIFAYGMRSVHFWDCPLNPQRWQRILAGLARHPRVTMFRLLRRVSFRI